MHSERFITGQDMLQQVDGKGGDAVVESLKAVSYTHLTLPTICSV